MADRIPLRLKREPLVEAVWEMRFTSAKESVAELLPGLIFKGLPDKYPKTVRLPAADIPAAIAEGDPNLRYLPKLRLEHDNHAVLIGEHVVSLSCRRPYSGWAKFSCDVRTLIEVVNSTGLIERIERFSLKYIDLIQLDEPPNLGCLNVNLALGGQQLKTQPVQLRTEIKRNGLIHIVQIISPATASLPGEQGQLTGVVLDTDTIRALGENESWAELENLLDEAHSEAKELFFGLLTSDTVARLGPEYGD
jgi:uncharacterized protein (TIGR04255 family)